MDKDIALEAAVVDMRQPEEELLSKTNWLMSLNVQQKEALRGYAREHGQTMAGVVQGWINENCFGGGR